ncbi:ACP S-malonyltransferase [Arhodomonas sp. SL1]|uniref:ACP S-malonyltransferase n=1 Tax=Arhodomonas sp. SL1 TaxID=3425691 RepID=UPI003F885595
METDDTLGFVFPGQGSQSLGMLAELAEHHPAVRATFDEASTALALDLWRIVQEGPEQELNRTEITQPALLTAGVAVWRAWVAAGGPRPAAMAGHSLGEYTALVCSGALAFADAVTLVHDRGRFMQEAVPAGEGAMAAILGLDDEAVTAVCADAAQGEVVEAVNFNAPGQVVIAGNRAAVDRAIEGAREAGAKKAVPLPVSVPSHCALMRPAAERMGERLAGVALETPAIPVLHNVDAAASDSADGIRERLVAQLYRPVRWVEVIRAMQARGVGRIVEAGPGKVLAGLNRRIDRRMPVSAVLDPDSLDKALEQ